VRIAGALEAAGAIGLLSDQGWRAARLRGNNHNGWRRAGLRIVEGNADANCRAANLWRPHQPQSNVVRVADRAEHAVVLLVRRLGGT
jgi:hypothetical protein